MITRLRSQLTYANLMATAAVFIALGGGAWAVAKNSVDARAIENGTVRSQELKNDDVRGADIEQNAVTGSDVADGAIAAADVADGSLGGAEIADGALGGGEIADGSLGGADLAASSLDGSKIADGSLDGDDVADDGLTVDDIDESTFSFVDVPTAGVLTAQARGIGGGGTTTFGPLSGRAAAGAIEEVRMALPTNTVFGGLSVFLADDLAAGESRTFTVVLQVGGAGTPFASDVSCTITANNDSCFDNGTDGSGALMAALQIESTGAGLDSNEDAYIGLAAKTNIAN